MENKISEIQSQKKDQDRLNIFIDDKFAFGISRFIGHSLMVGQELGPKQIELLADADEREKAYQRALRFISYKPRTVFEVREKLQKYEFEEIIIHSVLQELEDKNYVNDRNYAAEWIQTRSSSKPRSRRQLSFELRKKGISDDIIENEIIHALDDLDSALKLGRKYLNRYHQLDEKEFQKKMFGVLARRAFPFEIINKTIEKLLYERPKFD